MSCVGFMYVLCGGYSCPVPKDEIYKFFEIIFINPFCKVIRRILDTQWITISTRRYVGCHLQPARALALNKATNSTTLLVSVAVQTGEGSTI